ncbi:alpha/beta hydrolase [Sphingobium sp. AN641]|uniref:alpha/beta hydrolase n=1 Tax=Sphingobium sp. AN641 TaxID=3133443 RepID=UPI0030C3C53F
MPSPEHEALTAQFRAHPLEASQTPEQLRSGFAAMAEMLAPPLDDAEFEAVDAGGVPGEWVNLPGTIPSRVLLYLHGGGYFFGSAKDYRGMVSRLCRAADMRGLSLDYRLAPENKFPAALDDALAGYQWLLSQGVPSNQIVIAGDSAGGGLTLAVLVALRDQGAPLPAAAVCISPFTDQAKEGSSILSKAALDPIISSDLLDVVTDHYIGREGDPRSPLASPLYAELAGLPPVLILVGSFEVLLDDSTRFAARAKSAGVELEIDVWEGMTHIWPFFAAIIPEGRQAIEQMGAYIADKLA